MSTQLQPPTTVPSHCFGVCTGSQLLAISLLFGVKRVAVFRVNASDGSLYFAVGHDRANDYYVLWCAPNLQPGTVWREMAQFGGADAFTTLLYVLGAVDAFYDADALNPEFGDMPRGPRNLISA